jgi:hypothetical protein
VLYQLSYTPIPEKTPEIAGTPLFFSNRHFEPEKCRDLNGTASPYQAPIYLKRAPIYLKRAPIYLKRAPIYQKRGTTVDAVPRHLELSPIATK